jgi:hypothetical protein
MIKKVQVTVKEFSDNKLKTLTMKNQILASII